MRCKALVNIYLNEPKLARLKFLHNEFSSSLLGKNSISHDRDTNSTNILPHRIRSTQRLNFIGTQGKEREALKISRGDATVVLYKL